MLLCRATRSPLPLAVVPLMALSRLVLGVHYPSDVLAGIAVGAAVARVTAQLSGEKSGDTLGDKGAAGSSGKDADGHE